jgi:hypothetical protein
MSKQNAAFKPVKPGERIQFRLPSDTPDHILNGLNELKRNSENFSAEMQRLVFWALEVEMDSNNITLPLPSELQLEHRKWLENNENKKMMGRVVYAILTGSMGNIVPFPPATKEKEKDEEIEHPPEHIMRAAAGLFDDDD